MLSSHPLMNPPLWFISRFASLPFSLQFFWLSRFCLAMRENEVGTQVACRWAHGLVWSHPFPGPEGRAAQKSALEFGIRADCPTHQVYLYCLFSVFTFLFWCIFIMLFTVYFSCYPITFQGRRHEILFGGGFMGTTLLPPKFGSPRISVTLFLLVSACMAWIRRRLSIRDITRGPKQQVWT